MTGNPVILVGDVGGTTTDVALLDERLAFRVVRSYPSRKYGSLNDIVHEFLRLEAPRVTHACFGIAGPVRDGASENHKPAMGSRSERPRASR